MVRIFLRILNRMIGLRLAGGPLGLPGLGSGSKRPWTREVGASPVAAVLLMISAIFSKDTCYLLINKK